MHLFLLEGGRDEEGEGKREEGEREKGGGRERGTWEDPEEGE